MYDWCVTSAIVQQMQADFEKQATVLREELLQQGSEATQEALKELKNRLQADAEAARAILEEVGIWSRSMRAFDSHVYACDFGCVCVCARFSGHCLKRYWVVVYARMCVCACLHIFREGSSV